MDFKAYYRSKVKLLEAVDSSPKVKLKYKLLKYCKIPLAESVDSSNKSYIALKPDDIIEILWEYDSLDSPTVRYVKLIETDQTMFPVWSSNKIFSWALNNASEI